MRSVIQKRKLNFIYKVRTQNTVHISLYVKPVYCTLYSITGIGIFHIATLVLLFWQPYDPPAVGLTYFGKNFFFLLLQYIDTAHIHTVNTHFNCVTLKVLDCNLLITLVKYCTVGWADVLY